MITNHEVTGRPGRIACLCASMLVLSAFAAPAYAGNGPAAGTKIFLQADNGWTNANATLTAQRYGDTEYTTLTKATASNAWNAFGKDVYYFATNGVHNTNDDGYSFQRRDPNNYNTVWNNIWFANPTEFQTLYVVPSSDQWGKAMSASYVKGCIMDVVDGKAYYAAYIKGFDGDWNNSKPITIEDGKYVFTYTADADGDHYFRFSYWTADGLRYVNPSNDQDVLTTSGYNFTASKDENQSNSFKLPVKKGGKYTITITNGKLELKVDEATTPDPGPEPTPEGVTYTLHGDGFGTTWATGVTMEPRADGTFIYIGKVTKDGVDYFNVSGSDGSWYGAQSVNQVITVGTTYETVKGTSQGNNFKINLSKSYGYTIIFNPSKNTFLVDCDNVAMPVLPARVKSVKDAEGWATVTTEHPAVYLIGEGINNWKVTPEWEMIPSATNPDVYELNGFALRPNAGQKPELQAFAYDSKTSAGSKAAVYTVNDLGNDLGDQINFKVNGTQHYIGVRYNASYNAKEKKLTITRAAQTVRFNNKDIEIPVWLGLVGNFTQKTTYSTPANKRVPQTTKNGWQESWIQYDANGQVAKDLNGNVMYNTMFPPKNPIMFTTPTSDPENPMEVVSDNMAFRPYSEGGALVMKTGAQWKEFFKGNPDNPDYDKLFEGEQKLNDNDTYVRYIVNDMWISGKTKIWTGWNGGDRQSGDKQIPDWTRNASWGYADDKEDGTEISKNTAYTLKFDGGNFKFANPTYFKTVEMFYCINATEKNDDPYESMAWFSKFYTTQVFCNATIQARAEKNTYGGYYMTFDNKNSGVDDTDDITYRVYRFNANVNSAEADINMWQPVTRQNQATDLKHAVVISGKTTVKEFKEMMNQWLADGSESLNLADGNYFYALQFEAKGKTGLAKSNPFSIQHAELPTLVKAFQVIRDKDDATKVYGYNAETGRVFPITYELEAEGDKVVKVYTEGEELDAAESKDVLDNGTWTSEFAVVNHSHNQAKFQTLDEAKISKFQSNMNRVNPADQYKHNGVLIVNFGTDDAPATLEAFERAFSYDYTYIKADGELVSGTSTPAKLNVQATMPSARVNQIKAEVTVPSDGVEDPIHTLTLDVVADAPNTDHKGHQAQVTMTGVTGRVTGDPSLLSIKHENLDPNVMLGTMKDAATVTSYPTNNPVYVREQAEDVKFPEAQLDAPAITSISFDQPQKQGTALSRVIFTEGTTEMLGESDLNKTYFKVEVEYNNEVVATAIKTGEELGKYFFLKFSDDQLTKDQLNTVKVRLRHAFQFENDTKATLVGWEQIMPANAPALAPANPEAKAWLYSAPAEISGSDANVTSLGNLGVDSSALAYTVEGRSIVLMDANAAVYTVQGMLIHKGRGTVDLPSGVYIVTTPTTATKVAL